MRCVRCNVNPRKHFRLLKAAVDVVVSYKTYERKVFQSGDAFCIRCMHSVLELYRGNSEGMTVDYDRKGGYVRSDGVRVL